MHALYPALEWFKLCINYYVAQSYVKDYLRKLLFIKMADCLHLAMAVFRKIVIDIPDHLIIISRRRCNHDANISLTRTVVRR